MAHLILVRHARSEWNAKGIWTGWRDIGLSERAEEEVTLLAQQLPSVDIHVAYTSMLRRAQETLRMLLAQLGIPLVPVTSHPALNERNYGMYTGRNKWEVRDELGGEAFFQLRRGWDVPVPDGETLKDVYERVVPYYQDVIRADVKAGRNVLVVAHGNTLRALVKHLEQLSAEDVMQVKIGVAEAYIYEIDAEGNVVSKETRTRGTHDAI